MTWHSLYKPLSWLLEGAFCPFLHFFEELKNREGERVGELEGLLKEGREEEATCEGSHLLGRHYKGRLPFFFST